MKLRSFALVLLGMFYMRDSFSQNSNFQNSFTLNGDEGGSQTFLNSNGAQNPSVNGTNETPLNIPPPPPPPSPNTFFADTPPSSDLADPAVPHPGDHTDPMASAPKPLSNQGGAPILQPPEGRAAVGTGPLAPNAPTPARSPEKESGFFPGQKEKTTQKNFLNPSLQEYTSVRYNDAPLQDVLSALAASARINIVLSSKVPKDQLISLRLNNVTYDTVIKTILNTLELDYIVENGIMRVLPRLDVMKEKTEKEERNKISKKLEAKKILIKHIKFAKASDLSNIVSTMVNDVKSEKNALGGESANAQGDFKIQADGRTNSLLIHGTQDEITLANEIIAKLDKKKDQILIEARIVEASNDLAKTLGITWGTRFGLDGQRAFNSGIVFPSSIRGAIGGAGALGNSAPVFDKTSAPQFGNFNFSLGSLNGLLNLDGILKAYEAENMANVIASPRIMVQDQEKAEINDNTQGEVSETGGKGSNLGVKLSVTPQIASDSQIELDINVNRSSPSSRGTSEKSATTKLVVKNGDTAVIGGLYQTSRIRKQGRIPFLGKLPIVGFLFRDTQDEWVRTELLVMITPRIQTDSTSDKNLAQQTSSQTNPPSSPSANSQQNTPFSANALPQNKASNGGGFVNTTSSQNSQFSPAELSSNGDILEEDENTSQKNVNGLNTTAENNGGNNSNGF